MIDVLVVISTAILSYGVVSLAAWGIDRLLDIFRGWKARPQQIEQTAEMSDTDTEKIRNTKEVITECFGENAVEKLRKASNKERIALVSEFADRLVKEYGLDIDVDITMNEIQHCGYYDHENKKAVFNIVLLMMDGADTHFDYCVFLVLSTIIHELRHAVQHKAIEEPGFWNIEEDRRMLWANNLAPGNYVEPSKNMKKYSQQPIETDAVTFAGLAMEGVC